VATVRGRVTQATLRRLEQGVDLADGRATADEAILKAANDRWSVLELVIHEGRKHIVRRMCKSVGHPVERLLRTKLGGLELGDLAAGEIRELSPVEVSSLLKSIEKHR
jgi:23S rRNA pseudouridine2605 synthase